MSIQINRSQHRRWPVSVMTLVCQDDGSVVEVENRFIGHFRPFNEDEVKAIRSEIFGDGTDEELDKRAEGRTTAEQAALETAFYERLMCGWEAVLDEAGQPVPFTPATFKDLAAGPDGHRVRRGLAKATLEIRFGIAPAKNVGTSPEPGPAASAGEVATS